jgi:hypothetical protein
MADGSRHSMAFVAESSYGVTPATPAFVPVRHKSVSLALKKGAIESEEIRGDRQISDYRHGTEQVGGDLEVELSYGSFDALLEATLCGTWTTNVLRAGSTRRSFTFERRFADMSSSSQYHRFTGCELASMKLSVTPDKIAGVTLGIVGQGLNLSNTAIAGSTYAASSTTMPITGFGGTINEGGSAIAVITEIQLTLENGIEPRYVVGSAQTIRPSIGRSNLSGQITCYFEDVSLLNKFIGETESSLYFELQDTAGNEYQINLPRIKYTGGQPDVKGEGPITISMPFQALYSAGNTSQIVITRVPA